MGNIPTKTTLKPVQTTLLVLPDLKLVWIDGFRWDWKPIGRPAKLLGYAGSLHQVRAANLCIKDCAWLNMYC